MVKVRLLRDLDGKPAGATAEYPKADADRLVRRGAVTLVGGKAAPKSKALGGAPENKGSK